MQQLSFLLWFICFSIEIRSTSRQWQSLKRWLLIVINTIAMIICEIVSIDINVIVNTFIYVLTNNINIIIISIIFIIIRIANYLCFDLCIFFFSVVIIIVVVVVVVVVEIFFYCRQRRLWSWRLVTLKWLLLMRRKRYNWRRRSLNYLSFLLFY